VNLGDFFGNKKYEQVAPCPAPFFGLATKKMLVGHDVIFKIKHFNHV
jgi:hypothetical protein